MMNTKIADAMRDLRMRSGEVKGTIPLVAFLYDLLRDRLVAGTVEMLTQHTERIVPGTGIRYSNGWLAKYAEDIAKRLVPSLFIEQVTPSGPSCTAPVVLDADDSGRTAVKDEEDTVFAKFNCSTCIHFVRDVRWESDECTHHARPKNALLPEWYTHPTWCPLSGHAIANMENAKALIRNAEGAICILRDAIKEIKSGKRVVAKNITVKSLIYEVT